MAGAVDVPADAMPASVHGAPGGPLRLGYVIDTLLTGGAERLVVTFAETVRARRNVDLTVFVLDDSVTPFRERLQASGIRIVTLPGRNLVDMRRFGRLVRALRKYRIDYVHAHLATSTTLAAYAAFLLRIPFVTTIHNVKPSARRVRKGRQFLHDMALRLPGTRVITVAKAVTEALKAEGFSRPCTVIPNAVSMTDRAGPDTRQQTRAELGLAPDAIAIVCVGAIIGQKAHEVLFDSFAKIHAAQENAVLLIVGDSRDADRKENLVAQADRLGITAAVKFLGMRRDIPHILAASDIFVSSSDWEGAPVSLLEAMVNGLPPVMTDVGENAAVLDGTGAIIVPPRQPDALAEGVLTLAGNPGLRAEIAQAVMDRASGTFGAETWVDRLLAYYAETGRRRDWMQAATT